MYTLNGELILEQNVCAPNEHDDWITACAFYEGHGNEWVESELVFTGHRRGVVNVWRKTVGRAGKWGLEFLKRLDGGEKRGDVGAVGRELGRVTSILALPQCLYIGDEDGRVWQWECVQRER